MRSAGSGPVGPKFLAERRRTLASAFETGGDRYARVRPGYPQPAVDWLLAGTGGSVVELGAGTGKLTEALVDRGRAVIAVDPSADMLEQLHAQAPHVPQLPMSAEEPGWPKRAQEMVQEFSLPPVDLVLAAQAWHWFDPLTASSLAAQVLHAAGTRGTLGLIWNQLDVSVAWVHRLSRIMHAGDVHRPGFTPQVGAEFGALESTRLSWVQELSVEDLFELVRTRSYYLRASASARARLESNLRWYLFEHLGHKAGYHLELPYLSEAFRTHLTPLD